MPCFIRQIKRLGIRMPNKVSLIEDAERIEDVLKAKLKVNTHEQLRQKLDEIKEEELKYLLYQVLETIRKEKILKDLGPPDRLHKQREKGKEIWRVTSA